MCRFADMTKRLSDAPIFTFGDVEIIIGSASDDLVAEERKFYSATQIIDAVTTSVSTIIRLRAEELMPD